MVTLGKRNLRGLPTNVWAFLGSKMTEQVGKAFMDLLGDLMDEVLANIRELLLIVSGLTL